MAVLVTGGAGFIGSAVSWALVDAGIEPIVLDNLSAGSPGAVAGITLHIGDVNDSRLLERIFESQQIEAVVHCAALKSVPDSVARPLAYYEENVGRTIDLLTSLVRLGCRRFVFSSSASVYADGAGLAVTEQAPTAIASPYARTKLMVEQILADVAGAEDLQVAILRYFNPIGADPQFRTGPSGGFSETALGSLISAHRQERPFRLMGTDWPTPDGTAVRDYVHVRDVAEAHVATLNRLIHDDPPQIGPEPLITNVGSGSGTSLTELVRVFNRCVDTPVQVEHVGRRPGDVAGGYADITRATKEIGWSPRFTLEQAIRDSLTWDRRLEHATGTASSAERRPPAPAGPR